ncbi:MAG: lamin tail domain-containing protein [Actinomycetota bacterium]
MFRRTVLTMFVTLAASSAVPAHAQVTFTHVYFNPPGKDDGSNKSLNKELVVLVNDGSKARRLRGWTIVDKGGDHRYRIPRIKLGPGDTMRLRTGSGKDYGVTGCNGACHTQHVLHWGLDEYVWDNAGDAARLKDRRGRLVDRCRYGEKASSPKECD